jgi:hypothetical protein
MKDKITIKPEKLAEQEAQRKALGDLLDGLGLHKGRFSDLLGIKSRGTVYTWLAAPDDGGVPIPGPVWRWVELLADQPHMLGWLERMKPKETGRKRGRRNAETKTAEPHEWRDRPQFMAHLDPPGAAMQVCSKCGIIQRADGKNSPCKGVAKVALREADAPVTE